MGENYKDMSKDLEKSYCPPLDPALFTAIVSDYDLADSIQLSQLRETLDALRLSAWEQEDLPFDPSGTSGLNSSSGLDSDPSLSQGDVLSRGTDGTSEFSALSLSDKSRPTSSAPLSYIVGPDGALSLSGASEEDKIFYLTEMFPTAERFTIQHTLRKSNGDVDRSMDVLLNLAFFEEQPTTEDGAPVILSKGVDGFENDEVGRKKGRKRKGKNRRSRKQRSASPISPDHDLTPTDLSTPGNKWEAAQNDVDFICARTFPILKKETVTSTYHANGASLPATIRALAVANAPRDERVIHEHPVMATQVAELTQEFPTTTRELLAGLLIITRNSISAAHELASTLLATPAPPSVAELIKITTSPPPLEVEQEVPKRPGADSGPPQAYEQVTGSAGYHYAAGAEALTKASAAYRRGKSDRLMGGAAAYYSALGRDHLERAKRDAAAAADALVDSQSTWNSLDLHGVSVQDAVRITSWRVAKWWDSLGDSKYMRGSNGDASRGGYRIITGMGRHSHDGNSRLGPAVGKMLAREGWKVEVGEGVLTVVGVVRRR
ncbi:Smr domain protein [Aspergillus lucknowensis]|uniref:Smr domain protein n=1 Tax=Aspergillus lucknowensis TaxID=176173 RepID=A0ABR4LHJ1_9EURO